VGRQALIDPNLERLIEKDLYNELRWLLVAAASWTVTENRAPAAHFHVLCMDSAFVHARQLLEFFTVPLAMHRRQSDQGKRPASCHSFGVQNVTSPFYDKWRLALEARLMHLRMDREWLTDKKGGSVRTAIKLQVLNAAHEVLRLWDEFAAQPEVTSYRSVLDVARAKAVEDADHAARKLRVASPFSAST
jgi:hypothetical protein